MKFTCLPSTVGAWSVDARIHTNVGLDPFVAAEPTSVLLGQEVVVNLYCGGGSAPVLDMREYSGVVLHTAGAKSRHLEHIVAAEWEQFFLDPTDAVTNVTAALVAPEYHNRHACSPLTASRMAGKIALVKRSRCNFQTKASYVQEAGGVGVLFYDHQDTTTFRLMGLADQNNPPSIPGFLVTRLLGLSLRQDLECGKEIGVSLVSRPLVLWTHHPASGFLHYASGSLQVNNSGNMPFSWRISRVDMLNYDHATFYNPVHPNAPSPKGSPTPQYEWNSSPMSTPSGLAGSIDDTAAQVTLPFKFPFYGKHEETMHISSNGLLSFSPHYVKGADYYGNLPSLSEPNGLIAPYWDDLYCNAYNGCRLSSGVIVPSQQSEDSCGGQEAYAVQYLDFEPMHKAWAKVSVEARLHRRGCIQVMFKQWPSAGERSYAKIGVETMDGQWS
jgi:hypothetical protein